MSMTGLPTPGVDCWRIEQAVRASVIVDADAYFRHARAAMLKEIEDEAFMGLAVEGIIIPDGCTTIGSKAFADCPNLIYIKIPASVTSIADDAFEGSNQVRIDRT